MAVIEPRVIWVGVAGQFPPSSRPDVRTGRRPDDEWLRGTELETVKNGDLAGLCG